MKNKNPIYTFEDLEVYRLAREFSRKVSSVMKSLPRCEDYNLKPQMKRAKLSSTNNIAEGFGQFHYQENIQFCRQARGSICELIDDFNECYDEGYIVKESLEELRKDAYRVIKVLNAYIASIRRSKERVHSE